MTLTDSTTDPDLNGSFSEPLPAGTYTGTGPNAWEVEFESKRNGGRGPGFFQLDTRLQYDIPVPGTSRRFQAFVDLFNVTNRANFANPPGDRRLTNFLQLSALRAGGVPRTLQLGARFAF
jgi:hypothetical protein